MLGCPLGAVTRNTGTLGVPAAAMVEAAAMTAAMVWPTNFLSMLIVWHRWHTMREFRNFPATAIPHRERLG